MNFADARPWSPKLPVQLYARTPGRLALQVAGDVALLIWVWVWIRVAHTVHDATLRLGVPGEQIDRSASDLASRLRDAGDGVAKVPYVGDDVRKPFDGAGGAAEGLAGAGRAQVHGVDVLAHWLGLAVALIPILVLLWYYLPQRIRFVRRATASQRYLDARADLDLFALRAIVNQPLHKLAKLSDDPAGAWRRRDPDLVEELAVLELRTVGLRPPPELLRAGAAGTRG